MSDQRVETAIARAFRAGWATGFQECAEGGTVTHTPNGRPVEETAALERWLYVEAMTGKLAAATPPPAKPATEQIRREVRDKIEVARATSNLHVVQQCEDCLVDLLTRQPAPPPVEEAPTRMLHGVLCKKVEGGWQPVRDQPAEDVPSLAPADPPLLHETKALNPWQPERDSLRLAVLGKLAEELSEAGAIVARCIIQGVDEAEPVTGKVNRDELQKELADVWATGTMAIERFGLSSTYIARRVERKIAHLRAWHQMLQPPATVDRKED